MEKHTQFQIYKEFDQTISAIFQACDIFAMNEEIMLLYKNKYPIENQLFQYNFTIQAQNWNLEGPKKVGKISITFGTTEEQIFYFGNIGYHIHPYFQGHKYASKALKLLLKQDLILNPPGLTTDCYFIMTNPENIASQKTALSAGFQHVDTISIPSSHRLYIEDKEKYSVRHILYLEPLRKSQKLTQNGYKSNEKQPVQTEIVQQQKCMRGHFLYGVEENNKRILGLICDECDGRIVRMGCGSNRCEECDYDVCDICLEKIEQGVQKQNFCGMQSMVQKMEMVQL